MAGKKKSVLPSAEQLGEVKFHFLSDSFAKEWPGLYEFLAAATDNEEPRKGGTISLFAGDGKLKASFLDKQTQMVFFTELDPLKELWSQLEARLQGEHDMWKSVAKSNGKVPF